MKTGTLKNGASNSAYITIDNKLPDENGNFIINAYTKDETNTLVNSKIVGVFRYKGVKNTLEEIQAITDMIIGDIWENKANGENYAWNGTTWDDLGNNVNLDNYALKTELPTKTSELTNDSNFVVDTNYVHTDNNFTNTYRDAIGANTNKITEVDTEVESLTNEVTTLKNNVVEGIEIKDELFVPQTGIITLDTVEIEIEHLDGTIDIYDFVGKKRIPILPYVLEEITLTKENNSFEITEDVGDIAIIYRENNGATHANIHNPIYVNIGEINAKRLPMDIGDEMSQRVVYTTKAELYTTYSTIISSPYNSVMLWAVLDETQSIDIRLIYSKGGTV